MCKNVKALEKNISADLLDYLVWMVNDCIKQIENKALKYENCLNDVQDVNAIKDDEELLKLLKSRLSYSFKLTSHYWSYESNCNALVSELVGYAFDNSKHDNLHFKECVNTGINDSNKWDKECYCYDEIFHAVYYDVSCFVSKRYDEVLEIEENYKDLYNECEERIEKNKEKEEGNK